MRLAVLGALFVLALAVPAWAGFDEGVAAYKRGDYETALKEFRPLAEQGDAVAQTNVGTMYSNGKSVPQDHVEAVKWWRKAAEQGYADAQFNIGAMFNHGWGVPQDFVQAHMWFNLAASSAPPGDKRAYAVAYRDAIAENMTPADVSKAQRLAREWLEKHPKTD